jgi:DNA-binding transcriptional ArsR family regulator
MATRRERYSDQATRAIAANNGTQTRRNPLFGAVRTWPARLGPFGVRIRGARQLRLVSGHRFSGTRTPMSVVPSFCGITYDPPMGERSGFEGLLYEQFARVGKAVSSPRRIELLDLLCQGERGVDALAAATRMPVTTTSQHLQVLRAARLVETRREGTRVFYRVADEGVCEFLRSLQDLARARLAEVEQAVQTFLHARDELEPVRLAELMPLVRRDEVVVLDVRPADEFASGHIPGAVSVPLEELERRLGELSPGAEIVAYCRGPYCLLSAEAVDLLSRSGRRARRHDGGQPEWRHAG